MEAAMIKHCIEHHPNAVLMGLLHQFPQGIFIAKVRVNAAIIFRIVFMVAAAFKNGR